MYYIFDIDGTLANSDHRIHHITKTPKDWDSFFQDDLMIEDAKQSAVAKIFHALATIYYFDNKDGIIFLTGRLERSREVTKLWLKKHLFIDDDLLTEKYLIMRPFNDRTDDDIWKVAELDKIGKENIICIFEDRNRIVKAMRKAGYTVMHVADGDF